MAWPNFLVLGAAKAGTTALYYQLAAHPEVFMSTPKEPQFFAYLGEAPHYSDPPESWGNELVLQPDEYQALFEAPGDAKAIGEISPLYLYLPEVPDRIRTCIPDAKLVAMLRQPAERAFSAFCQRVGDGREPCADFMDAVTSESRRIAENWSPGWHYVQVGFYYRQLKRYYDVFDNERIRVYLYDDFNSDPLSVFRDLCTFLGIDEGFVPNLSLRVNKSGFPQGSWSQRAHTFLARPHAIKEGLKPFIPNRLRQEIVGRLRAVVEERALAKPELDIETRREVTDMYREDILRLESLIDKDLAHWLE